MASAKSDIRLAIPPALIKSPVRMNNGAAKRAKLFNPSNIELPTLASGKSKISCMPTTHMPIISISGVPDANSVTAHSVRSVNRIASGIGIHLCDHSLTLHAYLGAASIVVKIDYDVLDNSN